MTPLILILKTYKLNVEIHQHAAYQLVFTNDHPFHSYIEDVSWQDIFGFFIQPRVKHRCTANSSTLNIVNIEPFSSVGYNMKSKFIQGQNAVVFRNRQEMSDFLDMKDVSDFNLLGSIAENSVLRQKNKNTDDRVLKILSYINDHYQEKAINLKSLSDMIFISPSRLGGLFKQETGSSISKYLLWTRLRHAIHLILTQKNTTLGEIALQTGFYDLSQLHKYMYEMLGVAPNVLRKNSDLIQFSG